MRAMSIAYLVRSLASGEPQAPGRCGHTPAPWRTSNVRPLPSKNFTAPKNPALPKRRGSAIQPPRLAPVAQLDRALPSEGKGHTFESCRARQNSPEKSTS